MGQDADQVAPHAGVQEGSNGQTPDPRTVDEAKAQIEQTRDELSTTIYAIQQKLDPQRLRQEAESRVQELTVGKVEQVRQSAAESLQRVVEVAGEKAGQVAAHTSPVLSQAGGVTQQAVATAGQVAQQATTVVAPLVQRASQQMAAAGITPEAVSVRARTGAQTLRATMQQSPRTWLDTIRRNPLPFAAAGMTLAGVVLAAVVGRGRGEDAAEAPGEDVEVVIVATPPEPAVPLA